MNVAIAADHAGHALKAVVAEHVRRLGHAVTDLGTHSEEPVDHPVFGAACGRAVASGEADRGIVICGTGLGIGLAAAKVRGCRAVTCHDHYTATMARRHLDANVLALGSRVLGVGVALEVTEVFLATEFEGGRHARRVAALMALETGVAPVVPDGSGGRP